MLLKLYHSLLNQQGNPCRSALISYFFFIVSDINKIIFVRNGGLVNTVNCWINFLPIVCWIEWCSFINDCHLRLLSTTEYAINKSANPGTSFSLTLLLSLFFQKCNQPGLIALIREKEI